MTDNRPSDLIKRLESGYSLPSLSVIALRLVELASDDRSSAKDLASLIEKDPALTVRLLRLANSPFFAFGQPASTLEQAIVKIGFQRLRIMALSLSLRDTFPLGKTGPMDYEQFWRTSLYRALLAKSLAQHFKACNPDEAFVAGLISEIGLLVLFDILIKGRDEDVQIDLASMEDLLVWERERFGLDHRQVGQVALRHWGFPEPIVSSLEHQGKAALVEGAPVLARICEQAQMCSAMLFHPSRDLSTFFGEADKVLGLSSEVINQTLLATFEQVEGVAEGLKLELDREKDLMEIMEKANLALGKISSQLSDYEQDGERKSLPSFDGLDGDEEVVQETLQAVAHEIRNPLMAVGGLARRLTSVLEPSSAGGKYAQIIFEEALRLEKALAEMSGDTAPGSSST
jgi:HD-like signal output (HDOD) protein